MRGQIQSGAWVMALGTSGLKYRGNVLRKGDLAAILWNHRDCAARYPNRYSRKL